MNIVLAITIIIALGCAAVVRGICFYNLHKGTNKADTLTDVLVVLMFLSTLVFAIEFLFNPFNIIL